MIEAIKMLKAEANNMFVNTKFKNACKMGAKALEAFGNVENKIKAEIGQLEYTNSAEDQITRAYEEGLQKALEFMQEELKENKK